MIEGLVETLKEFHIETENIALYEEAFTHRSYTNEHNDCPCYDRLEFLGDSILDMVVGTLVYDYFPDGNSGVLSKARAALVEGRTLSSLSESVYGFASLVRYSQGERLNVKHHTKINEDVFESFIGAVYLDQGYEFVKNIIINVFKPLLPLALNISVSRDTKSRLQEMLKGSNIDYQVIEQKNLNSDNVSYTVQATVGGEVLGVGTGRNIREAETNAARDALEKKVGN